MTTHAAGAVLAAVFLAAQGQESGTAPDAVSLHVSESVTFLQVAPRR